MIILEIASIVVVAYGAWVGYKWYKGGKKKVDFTPWNDDMPPQDDDTKPGS